MAKWTRGLTNIKYMMTKCNIFEQSLTFFFVIFKVEPKVRGRNKNLGSVIQNRI